MRWLGNMGELRKAEGEKSSCGVPSPPNELRGVCVDAVENVSFDGVETPCWPDKYDDTDCLHGDLNCSPSACVMGEASGESMHAPTARLSLSARLELWLVVRRKLRPDCLRRREDGVDKRFEPREMLDAAA